MCGLCGVLRSPEPAAARRRRVEAMTRALAHRGPDTEGYYADEDLALGFRRLAVIDLATGNQPLVAPEVGAVVVYNGELYNFRELRAELAKEGQIFRTASDTEVVLRAYLTWGPAALPRLNGMFAFALWEPRRRTLTLARDRFGIKPLFLWRQGSALAFASEVRALLVGGIPPRRQVDPQGLFELLDQKYVRPDGCLVKEVESLPPATVAEFSPRGATFHRYWASPRPGLRVPPDEVEGRAGELLARAVARQLVADVPVGVFLSGGIDSSTVAALAQQAAGRPMEAFTVSFAGHPAQDEAPAARRAARHLGCSHHVLTVSPAQVALDLERLVRDLDTPLGDATAVPTWYVSRLARARVTVTLAGEGADELFGGYRRQRWDARLDTLSGVARRALPVLARMGGRPLSGRAQARLALPPSLARYLDWSRLFPSQLLAAVWGDGVEPPSPAGEGEEAEFATRRAEDPLAARLWADTVRFLPGDLLPKVDRMSMAHGLEVRVPYLDCELSDFLLALPAKVRVGRCGDKRLLRRVARRWLPRTVTRRRKQGFDVPIGPWLRGPLAPSLQDVLEVVSIRQGGWFAGEAVVQLVSDHLAGAADHGERLWMLLVAELWRRTVFSVPAEVPW